MWPVSPQFPRFSLLLHKWLPRCLKVWSLSCHLPTVRWAGWATVPPPLDQPLHARPPPRPGRARLPRGLVAFLRRHSWHVTEFYSMTQTPSAPERREVVPAAKGRRDPINVPGSRPATRENSTGMGGTRLPLPFPQTPRGLLCADHSRLQPVCQSAGTGAVWGLAPPDLARGCSPTAQQGRPPASRGRRAPPCSLGEKRA